MLPEGGALRSRTPLIALVHQRLLWNPAQGGRLSRERARRAGRCCARRGHERGLIADYGIQSRRISFVRPIFRPSQQELSRYLKYMARTRIPEFESDMPSHAVGLSQVRSPAIEQR